MSAALATGESAIRLGELRIVRLEGGALWIIRDDGEGMQADEELFRKHVEEFYRTQF